MMLIIKCINQIVGTVNIMISKVLLFSVDAHGLKSTAKVRAKKFLKILSIKAASFTSLESQGRELRPYKLEGTS